MRFFLKILSSVLALSWLASCSSDTTITDIPDYVEQDPLTFSVASSSTSVSRAASHELEQGFLVSTYKLYGSEQQQKVMDRYEASYDKTPYHGSKWNTVGEAGAAPDYFYQTQYERYWDLSAFPYRFHAITPCPKTADNSKIITGFELSDQELSIPGNYEDPEGTYKYITYQSQSVSDGVVSPSYVEDPYMIAQVERATDGTDWDLLQPQFDANGNVTATKTQITSASNTLTRQVPLRFHHINSKVRFGIYTTVTNFPAEALTISNVTITAKSAQEPYKKFLVSANGFESTLSESNPSDEENNFFDKGKYNDPDRETSYDLVKNTTKTADLKNATSREKAYFFDIPSTKVGVENGVDIFDDIEVQYVEGGITKTRTTPGGLLQIPQKGVELFVEFDINNEHYAFQLEIEKQNGKKQKQFDWRASCRYTYYIVVKHLVPFEIAFTATIEPWVTVTSSNIDTDLEQ